MVELNKPVPEHDDGAPKVSRLNKLPVYGFIGLVVIFIAVVGYGLATRGFHGRDVATDDKGSMPATNYGDRMKDGVGNGVIGANEPQPASKPEQAANAAPPKSPKPNPFKPAVSDQPKVVYAPEADQEWRKNLQQQFEQQELNERQRQRMKRLQSADAANDSPIAVNLKGSPSTGASANLDSASGQTAIPASAKANPSAAALYAAAMQAAKGGGQSDANGQNEKQTFLATENADNGYLAHAVIEQQTPYELKRGTFIPATLITGINSDLPGKITAQVRENVYDSASGHLLLIPQGTKLMGKYDAKVSYGQERVLVVWTDLIFPNGSTLQIGNMAGMDTEGYGGFHDRVDNHYMKTFGSAIIVALIGAGIDAASPNTTATSGSTASAAEEAFVQSFGSFAQQTISKNLDVQPTLEIRPGYNFNILVDKDIVFPGNYQG